MGDAEGFEPDWDPIGKEEESDGESEDANEEDEAATAENKRAALAASHDGGGGKRRRPPHHKYNVMLTNHGGHRAHGEPLYEHNIKHSPATLAILLEAHQAELNQWTQQFHTWQPDDSWTEASAIPDPRGGSDDAEWLAAGPYVDLAVVGRTTRVKHIEKLAFETIDHGQRHQSRLLMVEVKFHEPMAGSDSVRVIAGHLHNTIAKNAQP